MDPLIAGLPPGSPRWSTQRARSRGLWAEDWMAKFDDGSQLPGSEWIYAKLYASPLRIQDLLRDELPQLVRRLRSECGVRRWFFVRYKDAGWHLRLRLHVPSTSARQRARDVLEASASALRDREAIWRMQYDTYYREIERFGGHDGCTLVEHVFSVESDLVLRALRTWEDESDYNDYAMQLAAGWVVWMWEQLGLASPEILLLCRDLARGHVRANRSAVQPHSGGRGADERLSDRTLRERVKRLRRLPFTDIGERAGPWRQFCRKAAKPLKQLRVLADEQNLHCDRRNLAGNLAHMLIHRLYVEQHEQHERILYVQARYARRASWRHSVVVDAVGLVARAGGAVLPD